MNNEISVSIVVPVYSGAQYLNRLIRAQEDIKKEWALNEKCPLKLVEAIFVIDGAIDNSECILRSLASERDWIRVITLSRNFGQHPATIAGILHTSGDWVVTMDEDMQHDPRFLVELFKCVVKEKADIVFAKALDDVHQSVFRDLSSQLFKKTMSRIMQNKHITKFNSYRLLRGVIARAAASVCSHETYLDIALCWFTDNIESVSLPLKDERFIATGKSGYSFGKLLSHARRMMMSSRARSLRYITVLAVIATALSLFLGAYVVFNKIIDPYAQDVRGWASLFVAILFIGGIVTFMLGISMEYITTILLHSQGKPAFFVVDRSIDEKLRTFFAEEK